MYSGLLKMITSLNGLILLGLIFNQNSGKSNGPQSKAPIGTGAQFLFLERVTWASLCLQACFLLLLLKTEL